MSGPRKRASGDYDVGRGKPPKHTRWKAGQSGNPAGRPKGARGMHKQLLAHLQPLRDIVSGEMYASVTVRDGGKTKKMPALQAITRATIKSAATGSAMAQRTMLILQKGIEDNAADVNAKLFATAGEYKATCEAELRRCAAACLPEPQFVPHPDDIYLDWETLQVEFRGPVTRDGKAALDELLEERERRERAFYNFRAEAKQNPRDCTLPRLAMIVQERFDFINEHLPERCRKRLVNRMTQADCEEAIARIRAAKPRGRQGQRAPKARRTS